MPDDSSETVLVTGASGYIACHVVKLLLERGYKVRATVRDLNDRKKCDPLRKVAADALSTLSETNLILVEADLLQPDDWFKAVNGCDYVIHTASPFPAKAPNHPDELIKPAVDGTLNVLKACSASPGVKRVVLTSSIAAIMGNSTKTVEYNEDDWTDVEKLDINQHAYPISKTLAEKAAWDYVKDNPSFELSVINPGFVMGPLLHNCYCTSIEVLKRLLNFETPVLPKLSLPIADVRDVAEAHVNAMTNPQCQGKRHVLVSRTIWLTEMSEILKTEFKPQGYRLPSWNAPYFLLWTASLFDKSVKMVLSHLEKFLKFDNTRMQSVLGIKPIEADRTIIDMAYSLIDRGFVKKTSKYTPRDVSARH